MEIENAGLYKILTGLLRKDARAIDAAGLAALSAQNWRDLQALAALQRVMPLLWHRLKQKGLDRIVPAAAVASFREATRRNVINNLRLNEELGVLLSALAAEKIPLILLKGMVLSNAVYENIGLREMNDIDVLARPGDLERVAAIAADLGYRPPHPFNLGSAIQTGKHLPRLTKERHARIEIHWTITSIGQLYTIDPGGLWERAVPLRMDGRDALALSSEDLLLHICLHISYQHQFAFDLRSFCDIAEMIARFGPDLDWRIVEERAAQWGWRRGAYLALRLAKEVAGADVPIGVLERLRPTDMTDALLETARAQVFTDKGSLGTIPASFAGLLQSGSLLKKILIFGQRIFLPRSQIAAMYCVPLGSLRIYGCYLRRFVDVLQRHGQTLKKYHRNDASVKSLAERTNLIADWLNRPFI